MSASTPGNVPEVAEIIRRYLAERPNAAETVEGVAQWWLTRQRQMDEVEVVRQALSFLEEQGYVVRFQLAGGKTLFRRA